MPFKILLVSLLGLILTACTNIDYKPKKNQIVKFNRAINGELPKVSVKFDTDRLNDNLKPEVLTAWEHSVLYSMHHSKMFSGNGAKFYVKVNIKKFSVISDNFFIMPSCPITVEADYHIYKVERENNSLEGQRKLAGVLNINTVGGSSSDDISMGDLANGLLVSPFMPPRGDVGECTKRAVQANILTFLDKSYNLLSNL